MQTNRGEANGRQALSKPVLLGLTTAIVVGALMPLIAPHLSHPSMIYHSALHVASLSIAVFLSVVSMTAYSRAGGARLMFMMLGFIALAAVEVVYLLDSTGFFVGMLLPLAVLDIELPHIILLVMLCMFGLGVLKVNNK